MSSCRSNGSLAPFFYQRLDESQEEDLVGGLSAADYYYSPWLHLPCRSWISDHLRPRGFLRGRRRRTRPRQVRIPSLGRFFRRRSRRLVSSFGLSCKKVLKRLIEGRAHFAELFAGNYMFMQVSPLGHYNTWDQKKITTAAASSILHA